MTKKGADCFGHWNFKFGAYLSFVICHLLFQPPVANHIYQSDKPDW